MARFCTNCGATLDDNKKFCTECGQAMAETPEPVAAAAQPVTPPQAATAPQTAYQAPPPPAQPARKTSFRKQAEPRPAPAYGEAAPAPGSPYEPITMGGYIGIMLLMCIPVVGLVLAIVWAFGGCKKVNKRNLARASLVMMAVGLVISLILGIAGKLFVGKVVDTVEEETGISITETKENGLLGGLLGGKDSGSTGSDASGVSGLLSGLAGLAGGEETTNSDLEALDELGQLLEGLEGLTGETSGEGKNLSDLVDTVEDINAEAEKQSDGWPKSLRAYPGGTAKATASYRTEISGTTLEEYEGWIADLRADGFQYQDFYDFGMTEEDMLGVNGWWATDGKIYISLSYYEGTVTVDHMTELPDMSSLLG